MAALMTPRFVVTDEEIRHVNEGTCDQIPRDQPYSAVSISMNGKLGMAQVRILV